MSSPRLLCFSGSLRAGSFNHQLAREASRSAGAAGAETTLLRLSDHPLPLFNQDEEDAGGLPAPARQLKQLFRGHDGLIIASPEYNGSFSAALKNTIDWVSRAETDDEPALSALRGKSVLLLSASPGALGGLRGLTHLRPLLANLGMNVMPDHFTLPKAHEAFDADGTLAPGPAGKLGALVTRFVAFAGALKSVS
jgi:NAD(P)H-dependent FMN reductase